MRPIGSCLALVGMLVACGPRTAAEAEPAATPPRAAREAPLPTNTASEPETKQAVAATIASPSKATPVEPIVAADSRFPKRAPIIADGASSGLVAFVRQLPRGPLIWVGPLAGNGGRDVMVYLPAAPDPKAPVRLVFHFHGTHSERIAAKMPGMEKKQWVGWDRVQQTVDAIDQLQRDGTDNVALVYPLSAGKRREPGNKRWLEYDRMWMSPLPPAFTDDFEVLWTESRAVLREHFGVHDSKLAARAIAEGHSAGGIALFNIAEQGTEHVEEYLFLDASFQGWADGCFEATQRARTPALVSLVVTDGGIADPYGKHDPWCTELDPATDEPADLERWRKWCEDIRNDMRSTAGIFMHRTKVSHGKQPRHFVGGLELPADRRQPPYGRLPSTR